MTTWDDTASTFSQIPTGHFSATDGARIHRVSDRIFLGDASTFGGQFGAYNDYTGLTPLTNAIHNWGPRDAQLFVDSSVGGLAVVGHSQASKAAAWPAYPTHIPSSIGISGFAINDVANGNAWGIYSDAVALRGAGFTASHEATVANFGNENELNPFNHLTGAANGGIGQWVASGCGLDLIDGTMNQLGLYSSNVNHATAGTVYVSSFSSGTPIVWGNGHGYSVGDLVYDPSTKVAYRCAEAHTSNASSSMNTDRTANPNRWKARPAFKKAIVITSGSVAENYPGSNVFSAIEMPERHQITWKRKDGDYTYQSAYIWCDGFPAGSGPVGLTFSATTSSLAGSHFGVDGDKGFVVGNKKVVGAQQPFIVSPNPEVWSLKYTLDRTLQLLASHGLMAPS